MSSPPDAPAPTVVLRFRDFGSPTIPAHEELIGQRGYAWWGWWRKAAEPARLAELRALRRRAERAPVQIGLFDASTRRYFAATAAAWVFDEAGDAQTTPEAEATPAYYSRQPCAAWVRLTAITRLPLDQFEAAFGPVPVGDGTFFPAAPSGPTTPDADALGVRGASAPSVADLAAGAGRAARLRSPHVLQLSDVHFGADHGYDGSGLGLRSLLGILVEDVPRVAPGGVGLLVVSGDLTTRADANVLFGRALPFLRELARELSVPDEAVVIVPGNHDIALAAFNPLTYDHEAGYRAFVERFYGRARGEPEFLEFVLPDGRPLQLLLMNSVRVRTPAMRNYGYVEWPLYASALQAAGPPSADGLRIAVLHHHLVPAPALEVIDPTDQQASVSVVLDAGEVVQGLQEYRFQLAIHGHQHVPRVSYIARGRLPQTGAAIVGLTDGLYVAAAGSAGAAAGRLSDECRNNTYTLLSCGRAGVTLRVREYTPTMGPRDYSVASLPV